MTALNIRHTGLVVSNLEKSLTFYIDILGLSLWKREREKRVNLLKN